MDLGEKKNNEWYCLCSDKRRARSSPPIPSYSLPSCFKDGVRIFDTSRNDVKESICPCLPPSEDAAPNLICLQSFRLLENFPRGKSNLLVPNVCSLQRKNQAFVHLVIKRDRSSLKSFSPGEKSLTANLVSIY